MAKKRGFLGTMLGLLCATATLLEMTAKGLEAHEKNKQKKQQRNRKKW